MIEELEIRTVNTFHGTKEVIMSNKNGFWFPLVQPCKSIDKITGEQIILPKVVKFSTLNQATKWLTG